MENQPEVFQTEVFSWTSARHVRSKMLVFQDLEGLTEVFGRMSAGISGQKLPLRAEFSFLSFGVLRENVWHFWGKFWPEKITSRDGCFLLIFEFSRDTVLGL